MSQLTRVAIVTNNPVAFRVPVFERFARDPAVDLLVIYSAQREPGRKSDVPAMAYPHVFLKEHYRIKRDGYSVHNNPDVFGVLRKFRPHVVMNNGFQPTNTYALAYCVLHRAAHVPFTDGTDDSERGLSLPHRLLRRAFFAGSHAFVGASEGSRRLYAAYGLPADRFFKSHLCVDNARFDPSVGERAYDFIFCGRLIPEKRPEFAIEVAAATARLLGREVSLLVVGSGPLEEPLRQRAGQLTGVRLRVHGFASQNELPALYQSARLFLFPTQQDTWGVVANEACAAGLPVLVTPHAGVVGELVRDGENGAVNDFDVERWAKAAAGLLADPALWQRHSRRGRQLVEAYNYDVAAQGLVAATLVALGRDNAQPGARPLSRDAVRDRPG